METIKKNKSKGRIFEGKVKEAFNTFCYVYKSGVSTKGVDLIGITKLDDLYNIIFLIEAKYKEDGILTKQEIINIKKNFEETVYSIFNKTNLIPIPLIVLKMRKESYGSYLLIILRPFNLEEGFVLGFFKSLKELISFLEFNKEYLINELDKENGFELLENQGIIGFKKIKFKEKTLRIDL